jgi:hypothetical protein
MFENLIIIFLLPLLLHYDIEKYRTVPLSHRNTNMVNTLQNIAVKGEETRNK